MISPPLAGGVERGRAEATTRPAPLPASTALLPPPPAGGGESGMEAPAPNRRPPSSRPKPGRRHDHRPDRHQDAAGPGPRSPPGWGRAHAQRLARLAPALPPRARRHGRHRAGLRLLRHHRRRLRHVQRRRHLQLAGGVGPARHPGGRRQPADGRRRVRPVDRLDDRLRRHDDRDPDRVLRLAGLAVAGLRLRRRPGDRRAERLAGGAHRPAQLHRQPGLPVHPARHDHRAVDPVHQPHHRRRRQGPGGGRLAGDPVQRHGARRPLPLGRQRRADRHPSRTAARSSPACRCWWCGGWC